MLMPPLIAIIDACFDVALFIATLLLLSVMMSVTLRVYRRYKRDICCQLLIQRYAAIYAF